MINPLSLFSHLGIIRCHDEYFNSPDVCVIQEKASFVFFTLLQLIDIRGVAEFFFKSVKLGEAFFLAIRSIFFCSAHIKGKEEGSRISPHWNRVVVVVVSLSLSPTSTGLLLSMGF